MALAQHVNCHLKDKRVIAPTPELRLLVTRLVFSMARALRLLAFHLVDSHLHLVLVETRARAMQFARNLESAITQRLKPGVGFDPAYPEPIESQRHLFNAFDYVLRQQSRHGLAWDPYLEASNVPDLLGMRLLGRFTATQVGQYLPRVRQAMLLRYFGIDELPTQPVPITQLARATQAAAGLTALRGTSRALREARRAACEVAGNSLSFVELAAQLSISARSLRRLRRQPPQPELARAIERQLALQHALAGREHA